MKHLKYRESSEEEEEQPHLSLDCYGAVVPMEGMKHFCENQDANLGTSPASLMWILRHGHY